MRVALLGQYNIFGKLSGELDDLYARVTYSVTDRKIKMELASGFVWIEEGDDDLVEAVLPLLSSTLKLLELLKVPQPESKEATFQFKIKNGVVQDTSFFKDVNLEPMDDGDNQSEDGEPELEPEQEASDAKDPIPPEDMAFQNLTKIENLADRILVALEDIGAFKQRVYTKQPRERVSAAQRQQRALEHQRDRLKKQLMGAAEDCGDSNWDEDDEENPQMLEDPWLRVVRAFNSLRILVPILIPMFLHPRRNDTKLHIGKESLKKDARNPKCWLIGESVCSKTSVHCCKTLCRRLIDLLSFFGAELDQKMDDISDLCASIERFLVQTLSIRESHEKGLPDSLCCHPYNLRAEAGISETEDLAKELDRRFGLCEEKDENYHKKYLKAVSKVHSRIAKLLDQKYPGSRLSVYGSCLSDLSIGKSSDVDMSFYVEGIHNVKSSFLKGKLSVGSYQKEMKNYVYGVCRKLEYLKQEFDCMNPVTRARVPVVRGRYLTASNPYAEDGSLDFDICFLNDIAVANSSLIREYSLVDSRVKQLMMVVKKWAKEHQISSASDGKLSSYAWMNMVIFYLQCVGFVPNLQSTVLMREVGASPDNGNFMHRVNDLDTFFLTWDQAEKVWRRPEKLQSISVTGLLYGFFYFYAKQFPAVYCVISIKRGRDMVVPKTAFRRCSFFFCVEDPFETFDSHCPHDLSSPVDAKGAELIRKRLAESESHLRSILFEPKCIGTVQSLWPQPPSTGMSPRAKITKFQSPKKVTSGASPVPTPVSLKSPTNKRESTGSSSKGSATKKPGNHEVKDTEKKTNKDRSEQRSTKSSINFSQDGAGSDSPQLTSKPHGSKSTKPSGEQSKPRETCDASLSVNSGEVKAENTSGAVQEFLSSRESAEPIEQVVSGEETKKDSVEMANDGELSTGEKAGDQIMDSAGILQSTSEAENQAILSTADASSAEGPIEQAAGAVDEPPVLESAEADTRSEEVGTPVSSDPNVTVTNVEATSTTMGQEQIQAPSPESPAPQTSVDRESPSDSTNDGDAGVTQSYVQDMTSMESSSPVDGKSSDDMISVDVDKELITEEAVVPEDQGVASEPVAPESGDLNESNVENEEDIEEEHDAPGTTSKKKKRKKRKKKKPSSQDAAPSADDAITASDATLNLKENDTPNEQIQASELTGNVATEATAEIHSVIPVDVEASPTDAQETLDDKTGDLQGVQANATPRRRPNRKKKKSAKKASH